MVKKKNNDRGGSAGKDENRSRNPGQAGNPQQSYDKTEDRYEGYDEEKTSFDPNYENSYDEDINKGYDQNYGGRIKKASSDNSNEQDRAFDRGTADNNLEADQPAS